MYSQETDVSELADGARSRNVSTCPESGECSKTKNITAESSSCSSMVKAH